MELKSFRELLLKRADENPYLQTLIKYAKDDLIADFVIESLVKMAEPSAAMGRGANAALTAYAGQMTPGDVEQIRDALAHHISHYKAALKTHHTSKDPEKKASARIAADKHLEQIVPLMHLAGRASKHSNGKMVLDYRSTTPWETNYTTTERHGHNGKLKEGTKDLGRRAKGDHPGHSKDSGVDPAEYIKGRTAEHRNVPDYRYLEMPAHPGHVDSKHVKGGYPFEEIQLGSPMARDSGKAYLPLTDPGEVTQYAPHEFDYHPIHKYSDDKNYHMRGDAVKESFAKELAGWRQSPHHQQWLARQKAVFQKDPEAYKARGHVKPEHHFKDIPLHAAPSHAAAVAAPEEVSTASAPVASASAAPSPALDLSKPPKGLEHFDKIWSSFSPKQQQDLHAAQKGKK